MRFIPNSEQIQQQMLNEMGVADIEQLLEAVPEQARLKRPLKLEDGMPEAEQLEWFQHLAAKNDYNRCQSFLGAGSYEHFSPLVADSIISRGEFFTSYTPYQPEVSQGTLQAIFEFQTFMSELSGMEVSNASLYDGASACAEALLMADRLGKNRSTALVAESLHPLYRQVSASYLRYLNIALKDVPLEQDSGRLDLGKLKGELNDEVSCLVVQHPNFYGVVEDLEPLAEAVHAVGALLVVVVNEPHSLSVLKPPGACGADIVAGEAQGFGIPQLFGGPYLGFLAARQKHVRQIPGRLAGMGKDADGRRGFMLTLAAREQHIRRSRATSNICSNQNLVMVACLAYLTLMGRAGLLETAHQNVSRMHYFLERIKQEAPSYQMAFSGAVFNEVALECPLPAATVVERCLQRDLLPGLDLRSLRPEDANRLLVAVTEVKDKPQLDALVAGLKEAAS